MREPLKPDDKLVDDSGIHITNRTYKSKVVAEFVDAIPPPKDNLTGNKAATWVPQDGLKEGLQKAMAAPGRALLLLKYDKDAGGMSVRRALAKKRVEYLNNQGYRESMGWTVRAVDDAVYVIYDPRTREY